MSVILASERKSFKARVMLAIIYSALTLGAVTMIYPFAVMLAASGSSGYDYQRHSPFITGLTDRSDRFMRSISSYFRAFPRALYPDAPESWTTWVNVAKDREGITTFAARELAAFDNSESRTAAREYLKSLSNRDINELGCNYDARDVARFLKAKYSSIDKLNQTWPVPYRSFFDVSFSAELKANQRRLPSNGDKAESWREFKAWYLKRAIASDDFVSRTLPVELEKEREEIRRALAVQFLEHGWRDFVHSLFANYRMVFDFLFFRGRAFVNTIILVVLSVLSSLTVNPLAAYALSRFNLKATESIILFLLATMAFPAAVTAIPGFLLIRDLGMLNTFAALILPTIASGMSIFILKGFFDALPRELYEAASIDGASEWTVFTRITLPMTTPILAVNALNSFIHAYSSWEWAFLVCQKESHWTLAVWMYQMSQTFAHQPWCVMAGFVVVSIPTAVVFLVCQKVILKGIVLPSMK
ncbi:MAG: carbohydrate ABC transporter permease [Kiritimatiellae bacterium]|nr:carbohydrate ABC transporter permease [Kiritimatiellia bacterium]